LLKLPAIESSNKTPARVVVVVAPVVVVVAPVVVVVAPVVVVVPPAMLTTPCMLGGCNVHR
jgi:hypothetical protein